MTKITHLAIGVIGLYAGLLGTAHGVFELQQGMARADGIAIQAINHGCDPAQVWHACFPAMTLLPTLRLAGIAAGIFGMTITLFAVVALLHRPVPCLAFIGLAIALLLVGGGFIPPALTALAGLVLWVSTRPLHWLRGTISRRLAMGWPWMMWAYISWVLIQIGIGVLAPDTMLAFGDITPLIANLLLVGMILSALAMDHSSENNNESSVTDGSSTLAL